MLTVAITFVVTLAAIEFLEVEDILVECRCLVYVIHLDDDMVAAIYVDAHELLGRWETPTLILVPTMILDVRRGKTSAKLLRRLPRARSSLFRSFLSWQILSFGAGEVFELFLGHRLGHLFGCALKRRLFYFSAFGSQSGSSRHLLFF